MVNKEKVWSELAVVSLFVKMSPVKLVKTTKSI